jgi:hypothetical protein
VPAWEERGARLAFEKRLELELGKLLATMEDADVQLPAPQALDLLEGRKVSDLRPQPELPLLEPAEELQQTINRQMGEAADPQRDVFAPGPARVHDGSLEAREDLAGLVCEHLPRVSRRHDTTRPLEQLDAELLLKSSDRLGEGRLRDVQAFGRVPEVELLVDG